MGFLGVAMETQLYRLSLAISVRDGTLSSSNQHCFFNRLFAFFSRIFVTSSGMSSLGGNIL